MVTWLHKAEPAIAPARSRTVQRRARKRAQRPTARVLVCDHVGRLTVRRLRPWHRALARCAAARLDRELAAGTSPETSVRLAARALQLTSTRSRRDLADNLLWLLAAAETPALTAAWLGPFYLPRLERIRQHAEPLARLAGALTEPGPVPVRGVAMVSRLLADRAGPLYRAACDTDLKTPAEAASRALAL